MLGRRCRRRRSSYGTRLASAQTEPAHIIHKIVSSNSLPLWLKLQLDIDKANKYKVI